jgi:hypothetical protein
LKERCLKNLGRRKQHPHAEIEASKMKIGKGQEKVKVLNKKN